MKLGACRSDITLMPVSGKALPMRRGETMRLTQVQGYQCVDFNCFNLHNYKERMSVGHMRAQGFRVSEGHLVVSTPPYFRPMLAITHMKETCVSDLLGARCDATMGEREYDLVPRTNCQDTFAEAIREYGLTADDVHDSFNMWMNTCWGHSYRILPNVGPAGDYVDLLALMDVLAVPIVCGSGDLGQISNFCFKPIQVQIFEASGESIEQVSEIERRCGSTEAEVEQHSDGILAERPLAPRAGYQPRFRNCPIVKGDIDVVFEEQQLAELRSAAGGLGETEAERMRAAFMLWYRHNRMRRHWNSPAGLSQ